MKTKKLKQQDKTQVGLKCSKIRYLQLMKIVRLSIVLDIEWQERRSIFNWSLILGRSVLHQTVFIFNHMVTFVKPKTKDRRMQQRHHRHSSPFANLKPKNCTNPLSENRDGQLLPHSNGRSHSKRTKDIVRINLPSKRRLLFDNYRN